MRLRSFFVSAVLIATPLALDVSAQETEDGALGFWINRNGWVIESSPCEEGLCGNVIAVGRRNPDAQLIDIHNPDPELRQRPICGIAIFGSFEPNGDPGEWEGGWIYNPRDGKTYSSKMELGEGDTLEVRGYILSPIFGRTVVLNRAEEPSERCDPSDMSESHAANVD